jgi:hypothetical protein
VYNIEVDGDHCYRVGRQGLLVHNQSAPPTWCTSNSAGYKDVIPEAELYIRPSLDIGYIKNAKYEKLFVFVIPIQKEVHSILQDPNTAAGGSDPKKALADFFKPDAYWVTMFSAVPRPGVKAFRDALEDALNKMTLPGLALKSDASAGHIIGEQFGGPGRPYTTGDGDKALPNNLFPSARQTEINLAPLEKIWRDNATMGNKVCVSWKLRYPGGGCKFADRIPSRCRPNEIIIEYWIDCGGKTTHVPPMSFTQ